MQGLGLRGFQVGVRSGRQRKGLKLLGGFLVFLATKPCRLMLSGTEPSLNGYN